MLKSGGRDSPGFAVPGGESLTIFRLPTVSQGCRECVCAQTTRGFALGAGHRGHDGEESSRSGERVWEAAAVAGGEANTISLPGDPADEGARECEGLGTPSGYRASPQGHLRGRGWMAVSIGVPYALSPTPWDGKRCRRIGGEIWLLGVLERWDRDHSPIDIRRWRPCCPYL